MRLSARLPLIAVSLSLTLTAMGNRRIGISWRVLQVFFINPGFIRYERLTGEVSSRIISGLSPRFLLGLCKVSVSLVTETWEKGNRKLVKRTTEIRSQPLWPSWKKNALTEKDMSTNKSQMRKKSVQSNNITIQLICKKHQPLSQQTHSGTGSSPT